YIRSHFFTGPLAKLVEHMTDEQLWKLTRGGHDPQKVIAAYQRAVETKGRPTVILAKTVKGYGMGEAGEGKNITHQQKKMNEEELLEFRSRFGIPLSDEEVRDLPFYKPPENSPEIQYLKKRREALGGFVPSRREDFPPMEVPSEDFYQEFFKSSGDREVSTTMGYVLLLSRLLADKKIGKHIVPIIPDEARTFGMEALFRQYGIYSPIGQLYEPVDKETLLFYNEKKDGQILEEGITEAGAISSFIAAGTSYSTFGFPMIPCYIFYSMFGFQRIGDFVWAAADMKVKGFLLGATAGRTTLNGEGLQHQDGHSHLLASVIPSIRSYDPAYVYEVATIVQDGLERMYVKQEDLFYYLTLYNENYKQPEMPKDVKEGILKGLYKIREPQIDSKPSVHLFGSGPILEEALKAAKLLEEEFKIGAHVWSATSYNILRKEALEADRWNRLHPKEKKESYLHKIAKELKEPVVAASDYLSSVPHQIAPWIPRMLSLGTDGFGRSESREALRRYFEVDKEFIALSAVYQLVQEGFKSLKDLEEAIHVLRIEPDKTWGLTGC
ncbi:MAG: pyruvate dehydrogenase (acetyl-transferring), homodimeric type, partial [Planctomycetota bacterium]